MNETEQAILAVLDANNGRTSWDTVKAGLTYPQVQQMPIAIKSLKKQGIAQAQNRVVNGRPVFEVFRIGAPLPPAGS